jgi:hypothetical protein
VDTSYFREIVRTVTVSYPVPFLFAGLLAVFFFCFPGAAIVHGPLSWLFAGAGMLALLVAIGTALFAITRRSDLLRSERHSVVSRVIDLLDDGDMDQPTRVAMAKTIDGFMAESVPKKAITRSPQPPRPKGR